MELKNSVPTYLQNARDIRDWMEKNNTKNPPSVGSLGEEKRLAVALATIKEHVVKVFRKAETYKEKLEFFGRLEKNSNLSEEQFYEILEIVETIEKNIRDSESTHLKNAKDILNWMEETQSTKLPSSSGRNASDEEKRLGRLWQHILHNFLQPYRKCKTEEEKNNLYKKYSHIISKEQFLEVIDISKQILEMAPDSTDNKYLINARKIKEWVSNQNPPRLPNHQKKGVSDEEKKLGMALSNIRYLVVKPYESLNSESEREEFINNNSIKKGEIEELLSIINEIDSKTKSKDLPYLLRIAKELKLWVENENNNKLPRRGKRSGFPGQEGKFGRYLVILDKRIGTPYENCSSSEERRAFIDKVKLEYEITEEQFEEIYDIYSDLIDKSEPELLKKARAIKQWMIDKKTKVPPSGWGKTKKEQELGTCLSRIRSGILTEYEEAKTEDEENEFFMHIRRYIRLSRKNFFEIKDIVEDIDKNNPNKRVTGQNIGMATYESDAIDCDKVQEVIDAIERDTQKNLE